jgi:hypothetical protein
VARNFVEQEMKQVSPWGIQFSNLVNKAPQLHGEIGAVECPLRKGLAHHDATIALVPIAKALRHAANVFLGDTICSAPLKDTWHDLQSFGRQPVVRKDAVDHGSMI